MENYPYSNQRHSPNLERKNNRGHPAASAAHDRVPIDGKKREMNIEDNQSPTQNEFENTDPYMQNQHHQ